MSRTTLYRQMSAYQLSMAVSSLAASFVIFDQAGCAWSHSEKETAIETWANELRDQMSTEINVLCQVLLDLHLNDLDDLNYRREALGKAYTHLEGPLFQSVTIVLSHAVAQRRVSA